MSAQRYKSMARKHWSQWLPERVKELQEARELEQALLVAGGNAFQRVLELMQQGYRAHEAEEVALSEYILLKPGTVEPYGSLDESAPKSTVSSQSQRRRAWKKKAAADFKRVQTADLSKVKVW